MNGPVQLRRPTLRTRLLLYGGLPLVCLAALLWAYYGGTALRTVVSPEMDWVHPDSQREFGLLENLQNILLAAIAVVALMGVRRKASRAERIALVVFGVGAIFMLLEETDYGLQYLESDAPYNLHRLGYTEAALMHAAHFGLLTFFGAFAIVCAESKRPVLRYLAPDRFSVLTILILTAAWELALRLGANDVGSLRGNEIEFAELGVYYLVLLYAIDMVFWRTYRVER